MLFLKMCDKIVRTDVCRHAEKGKPMNEQPSLEMMKQRQKKNLRLVLWIFAGVVLLSLVTLLLLDWLLPKPEETPERDIYFYPVNEENIFENQDYLALNRFVYYCDDPTGYGLTTQITDEDRMSFDAEVRFAEEYLNILTYGDAFALRSMCTETYLKEHSIPDFTQQMVYESRIVYYSAEGQKDGSRLVTYRLEYKIHENNGTYRRDVGSDSAKPEYLVLWISADGTQIKIENILRS